MENLTSVELAVLYNALALYHKNLLEQQAVANSSSGPLRLEIMTTENLLKTVKENYLSAGGVEAFL